VPWSWTYLNAAFECLKTFNFGLNYGELGGLLPPVEDLHQRVLCFAAANFHVNSISNAVYRTVVKISALRSCTYLNAALVRLNQ